MKQIFLVLFVNFGGNLLKIEIKRLIMPFGLGLANNHSTRTPFFMVVVISTIAFTKL